MTNESIACCSMAIPLEPGRPPYRGGLGVPAGDPIRSAAGPSARRKAIAARTGRRPILSGGKAHPRHVARNGSHCNTQRMVQEYVANACS